MVVGFEGVGKSTILETLFPLQDVLQSHGRMVRTKYDFRLQGKFLTKYKGGKPHKIVTILDQQSHTFEENKLTLKLTPAAPAPLRPVSVVSVTPAVQGLPAEKEPIVMYYPSEVERNDWLKAFEKKEDREQPYHALALNDTALLITPNPSEASSQTRPIEISFPDESTKLKWLSRLRKQTMNEATLFANVCLSATVTPWRKIGKVS